MNIPFLASLNLICLTPHITAEMTLRITLWLVSHAHTPPVSAGVAVQRKLQQVFVSPPLFICEESKQTCSREEGRERGEEMVSRGARALGMELIP